ncbi:hypothetical protein XENOCAPTIV_018723, partial [Xenoophorus captivus]
EGRSVEDKQRVSVLTHIPKFLPEITIGAHDYDEKYYAYKSVSCDIVVMNWRGFWIYSYSYKMEKSHSTYRCTSNH